MAKNRRGTITIFEGRKGGGSRRAGKAVSRRHLGKFNVAFVPEKEWTVALDSRDLMAIVGTSVFGHLKKSIAADENPETGAAHPKTLHVKSKDGRRRTRDRDVDTKAMARALRRTVSSHKWRPGRNFGGWVRTQAKTRVNFYFVADSDPFNRWNALNKRDSTRKGRNRIIWLGVGGNTAKLIRPAIAKWADIALEGRKFDADTKQKARSGI